MQYVGLFFTFTFPGILVGILLAASKFFEDDRCCKNEMEAKEYGRYENWID